MDRSSLRSVGTKKYEDNRKELIANISHDLKTPLTSIIGYIEGLRDSVAQTQEKKQAYLNTMYEKSLTLNDLVDQLFLYSKLDIENQEFAMKKVELNSYVQDLLDEFHGDDSIDVKADLPTDKLYVALDTIQFDRVMANLIQNSMKFRNPENPILSLGIKVELRDNNVHLNFSDNGIGIAPEDLTRVFDRFYRADKPRASTIKGSGLGLSIVQQIVHHHNGSILAYSSLGEGTTFTIIAPIKGGILMKNPHILII